MYNLHFVGSKLPERDASQVNYEQHKGKKSDQRVHHCLFEWQWVLCQTTVSALSRKTVSSAEADSIHLEKLVKLIRKKYLSQWVIAVYKLEAT